MMEKHPYRHDWYKSTDVVIQRNSRGRIIEVKRHEDCRFCGTKRVTRIDTNVWERKGHPRYIYIKGQKIIRITARDFLKSLFLETTDLPHELFGAS